MLAAPPSDGSGLDWVVPQDAARELRQTNTHSRFIMAHSMGGLSMAGSAGLEQDRQSTSAMGATGAGSATGAAIAAFQFP